MNIKNFSRYKYITLFIMFFLVYGIMEVLFRALLGQMAQTSYFTFNGFTSLWMCLVGGIIGIIYGLIDSIKNSNKLSLFIKCLIMTVIIFGIEYLSGYILNIIFKLDVWNYYNMPLNINGQITFVFAPIWYFISVFGFWLIDFIKWCMFDEITDINNILIYYKKAIIIWK